MDGERNKQIAAIRAQIEELRDMLRGNSGKLADREVVGAWRERLHLGMRVAPELKPELGALMGALMRESKRWANREDYTWVSIGGGRLAVGHRPRRKAIESMPAAGVTHVVTLLCDKEGAPAIGAEVERAGLVWIWLPLENGDPPSPEKMSQIRTGLAKIEEALAEESLVYLHCSAGIHRTGMISYALLRILGTPEAESLKLLGKLRTVTSEGVGDHRLAWGNQFGD